MYLLSQMISKSSTAPRRGDAASSPVHALLTTHTVACGILDAHLYAPLALSLRGFTEAVAISDRQFRTAASDLRYIFRYDISLRDAICLLRKRDMIFVLLMPQAYRSFRRNEYRRRQRRLILPNRLTKNKPSAELAPRWPVDRRRFLLCPGILHHRSRTPIKLPKLANKKYVLPTVFLSGIGCA